MAYEATDLYKAMMAAEEAFNVDSLNLDKLHDLDVAEAAFYAALKAARAEWMALPEGDAKFSAETNAYDTEGTDEDELKWFNVALATYEGFGLYDDELPEAYAIDGIYPNPGEDEPEDADDIRDLDPEENY